MKRVLIGCPTYEGQHFCLPRFLERLKELDGPFDVLFVDNSESDKHSDLIKKAGYPVIRTTSQATRMDTIVNNRSIIINHTLEKKYDALLFIDTDVLPPTDVIPKLVSHKKDIIAGVYPSIMKIQGKMRQAPVIYNFSHRKDYFRPFPLNEVLEDTTKEIAACGFGCVLIDKKVLEKVKIRHNKELGGGEDILYCRDARELHGFKTFVDTSVRCTHMLKHNETERDLDFPVGVANFSFGYELE